MSTVAPAKTFERSTFPSLLFPLVLTFVTTILDFSLLQLYSFYTIFSYLLHLILQFSQHYSHPTATHDRSQTLDGFHHRGVHCTHSSPTVSTRASIEKIALFCFVSLLGNCDFLLSVDFWLPFRYLSHKRRGEYVRDGVPIRRSSTHKISCYIFLPASVAKSFVSTYNHLDKTVTPTILPIKS